MPISLHADALWSFFDALRAGRYEVGANAMRDEPVLSALAAVSDDVGLFDATVMKLTHPELSRGDFDSVVAGQRDGGDLMYDFLAHVFDDPGYDVVHGMACAWHQDIPNLFEDLADAIRVPERRAGALRVAACVSYLMGDPEPRFKYFADQLFRVCPEDDLRMNLSVALQRNVRPASRAAAAGSSAPALGRVMAGFVDPTMERVSARR